MLQHIYLVRNKKTIFLLWWVGSPAGSFCTVSYSFLCVPFPTTVLCNVPAWPSVMVSVQRLWIDLLGEERRRQKGIRVVEASSFWSSYSTVITSGHLRTVPVAKPRSGTVLPQSTTRPQFLSLVPQPANTWWVQALLQPPSLPRQPPALQSLTFRDSCCEFTINFDDGGFHPYPAVSIRHLVTCLAQIGTHQILNKRGGSNWAGFCV